MPRPSSSLYLPAQIVATLVALLVVILAPPVAGRMMLLPINGEGADQVAASALRSGALLLGAGPVSGSIVVVGNRAGLRQAVGGRAIFVLAAPVGGCGNKGSV